jgi:hypothetical protein
MLPGQFDLKYNWSRQSWRRSTRTRRASWSLMPGRWSCRTTWSTTTSASNSRARASEVSGNIAGFGSGGFAGELSSGEVTDVGVVAVRIAPVDVVGDLLFLGFVVGVVGPGRGGSSGAL